MSQNVALAPEPPERGGPDATLPTMSVTTKALIIGYLHDAKAYDSAALRLEMEQAAQANVVYPIGNSPYDYRQYASGEIAALVGLLCYQLPHASLEQRCHWVQEHITLSDSDKDRLWNALQGR